MTETVDDPDIVRTTEYVAVRDALPETEEVTELDEDGEDDALVDAVAQLDAVSEFDVVVVTVKSSEGEWLEEAETLGELDASEDHDGEYVGNDARGEADKESVNDAVADTLDVRSTDPEIDAEREPELDADDDLDTDGVDETQALADALRVTVPLLDVERVRVAQDETDGLVETERERQAVVELDTVTDTRVVRVAVPDAEIDTE